MKILVSNDDGVYAPGLAALTKSLDDMSEYRVVAPDRNRSGASNSLTLDNPLRVKTLDNGFVSVEGTPTDCVHLAITGLLKSEPDMVVSGINAGANLGDDVLYSGTVAAAMEGRFLGFPAIAVSLVLNGGGHYETAGRVVQHIVKHLEREPLSNDTILNVNVPDVPFDALTGIEVTCLGKRHCAEPTIKQTDPRGNTIYWVGPPGAEEIAGPGTDFYAITQNRVSITPIHMDLTHHNKIEEITGWADSLHL